jgi:hypothetical protein
MDRENSAAWAALTPAARQALRLIEREVTRLGGEARIVLPRFGATRTACRAIGQLTVLGFIKVGTGANSANVFSLTDGWQAISADEAARRIYPGPRARDGAACRRARHPMRQAMAPSPTRRQIEQRRVSVISSPAACCPIFQKCRSANYGTFRDLPGRMNVSQCIIGDQARAGVG